MAIIFFKVKIINNHYNSTLIVLDFQSFTMVNDRSDIGTLAEASCNKPQTPHLILVTNEAGHGWDNDRRIAGSNTNSGNSKQFNSLHRPNLSSYI